ncbi:hypothetical protein CUN85_09580 [Methanolobus halotolerans]|uniref:Uncharacterized protein n=1 Tax=Methanolobus halotolerans TaxID=2052935 RepID=A0A4E0Q3T5_9EURY|nr:hypothetical protein CUN85_09580 [Methanolobus halotolerans]
MFRIWGVDFSKSEYTVEGETSEEFRQKILSISYSEWKEMEFSKGTLHYVEKNAKGDKPFTLNTHNKERLDKWEKLVSNG